MQENENLYQRYRWFGALFLFVLTVSAYTPALSGGFIWDDDLYVTNNPFLRDFTGLKRLWSTPGATPQYYPLTFTSFWIEFQIWHLWATGYHLDNVLLHAGNALLLLRLLRMLEVPGNWFIAALFAFHPVHVESAAWIAERKNVLSGFFYLLSFIYYLRFSSFHVPNVEDHTKRRWYYYFTLILFLGALLSKTATCTLPAVILLLAYWKKGRGFIQEVPYLIPMLMLSLFFAWVTSGIEREVSGAVGQEWNHSFWERFLIAGRAVWFYIGKLFWPSPLAFLYPKWNIDAAVWWQWLFPIGTVVFLGLLALLQKSIGKAPLVALLFFVGTLFPTLGFFDVYFMLYSFVADHFQYLASIGPLALFGGILWESLSLHKARETPSLIMYVKGGLLENLSRTFVSCTILIILWCLTWQQGYIYESRRSLGLDTIKKNPASWSPYNDVAISYLNEKNYSLALKFLQKAAELGPRILIVHTNLCVLYQKLGDIDSALHHGQIAVALQEDSSKAQTCLGYALLAKGELQKAESFFRHAIELNSQFASPYYGIGIMYLRDPATFPKVLPKEAISYLEAALFFDSSSNKVLSLVAQLRATYPDATVRDGKRALQLAQWLHQRTGNSDPFSLDILAAAYAENSQFDHALETIHKAIILAQEQNNEQLLNQLRGRLQLYEENTPYRLLPTQINAELQLG